MDEFGKWFREIEEECPELAELMWELNDFLAGECLDDPTENMLYRYERDEEYRNAIDKAKEKYLSEFHDMGLFLEEKN